MTTCDIPPKTEKNRSLWRFAQYATIQSAAGANRYAKRRFANKVGGANEVGDVA